VLAVIVLAAALASFRSCSSESQPQSTVSVDPVYQNDYQMTCLVQDENGFYSYEDNTYTSEVGIDVSYANGTIDWNAVRQDGISFAYIRAGYRGYETGQLHTDTSFTENISGALAAGLPVGVYFFTQAINEAEAIEEAEYVLSLIQGYEVTLPIAVDSELVSDHDRISSLSAEEKTAVLKAFCQTIADAGYTPMVYGSASWLRDSLNMEDLQDLCQFWVASYQSTMTFPYVYSMWQYTASAQLAGLDHVVDLNLWIREK
jgi:GH25 family lysozyme M1 (1,4-beta-N-acetylmuramidase)